MKVEWFVDELATWPGAAALTDAQKNEIATALVAISRMNKGEVVCDTDGEASAEIREYCISRANQLLDSLARSYRRNLLAEVRQERYRVPNDAIRTSIPFLNPVTFAPKVDLNRASVEDLERLPGIGLSTAKRILQRRQSRGPFKAPEEVIEVKGIGKRGFEKFRHAVYVGPRARGVYHWSQSLQAFIEAPTFQRWLEAMVKSELTISRYLPRLHESWGDQIVYEIGQLQNELEGSGRIGWKDTLPVGEEEVTELAEEQREYDRIERLAIEGNLHCAIIDDSRYPNVLLELLKVARQRIRIVMFFMRFEDEGAYPTDALLEELRLAHSRGVDIRVILDQDAEGDLVNSRVINEEAFQYLEQNGIAVKYDSIERYTHTKLVVVDEEHTVVGSHNWTAGSFFAYDDTSAYVCSRELAQHYLAQFEQMWSAS